MNSRGRIFMTFTIYNRETRKNENEKKMFNHTRYSPVHHSSNFLLAAHLSGSDISFHTEVGISKRCAFNSSARSKYSGYFPKTVFSLPILPLVSVNLLFTSSHISPTLIFALS